MKRVQSTGAELVREVSMAECKWPTYQRSYRNVQPGKEREICQADYRVFSVRKVRHDCAGKALDLVDPVDAVKAVQMSAR